MSPDLRQIVDVAPLVQSGALSPVALVQACLAAIDARPELNAFITRLDAQALADAERAEQEIRAGRYRGPLHGIPISVKDLIHVAGVKTTSGSAQPAIAATSDAPAIARLKAAGAIIIGKTNLHEFAFGTTSEESAFGPVRNPHDASRSAGGSSGGAAAALATGMCFGALGTDTGGSIRIPSAACGTVGLKATSGEIACDGVVPLSTSLDHLGPMARSVADVALLFDVLTGRPARQHAPVPATAERAGLRRSRGRTSATGSIPGSGRRSSGRARRSPRRGMPIRDLSVEHAAWTPDVYLHIVLPEASRYHARFLERSPALYSPGVRVRLEMGRYLLAEDYVRAMHLRNGADGDGRSGARRVRRAAPADAPDSRAARSGPRPSTSTARPSLSARRCCGSRSSSTSPAIRRWRCRRRRTSTRSHGACRSSDGVTRPIGSSRSPARSSAACSRRFARRIRE